MLRVRVRTLVLGPPPLQVLPDAQLPALDVRVFSYSFVLFLAYDISAKEEEESPVLRCCCR